jgi:hypothetical protein
MRFFILLLGMTGIGTLGHAGERARVAADRTAEGFWHTDRARFLDSKDFHDALTKAVNGIAGSEQVIKSDKNAGAVADDILEILLAELASAQGVHIETALTTLGATAGFACQMAIRESLVASGKVSLKDAFIEIGTTNGETFYTGNLINGGLLETSHLSVWSLVAGVVQQEKKSLPDVTAIVKRTTASFGENDYGKPALPEKHLPRMTSEELLWKYWNVFRNTLVENRQEPNFWPLILAMAAQKIILQGKDVIDPTLAAQIVMEAAVPMSRIDPDRVYAAHFR